MSASASVSASASASASNNGVRVIENIQNYIQQYIDGALVLTPIKQEQQQTPVIEILNFNGQQLGELPELPQTLKIMLCENNKLTNLPEQLPETLEILACGDNNLTKLPDKLPSGLLKLYCACNKLTELPKELPPNLKELVCCNNDLTILPDLPETLTYIIVSWNTLETNYPDIDKHLVNCKMLINYVNQRNREMREEPTSVDEAYLSTNYNLKPIKCVLYKSNQIKKQLAGDCMYLYMIVREIYALFGIKAALINITINNNITILDIINMIKSNDQLGIHLLMKDEHTGKKYCYNYNI